MNFIFVDIQGLTMKFPDEVLRFEGLRNFSRELHRNSFIFSAYELLEALKLVLDFFYI